MGTTLTAMLFSGSKLGMVHIGDSRAYLLRDGEFAQITKDDTYVQMLVDEGRISAGGGEQPPAAVAAHPGAGRPRHRPGVLGPPGAARRPLPDLQRRPLRRGQRRDHRARPCASTPTRSSASSGWSQLALRGGGPDNITVIIADATDEDIVEATPIVGGAAARDRGMATSADVSTPAARASALLRARARPRPRSRRPAATTTPERPTRHPVRTAALLAGAAGRSLGGGAVRRLELHPVAVLRRRHRRRAGRRLPGRARARSPASTCPACTTTSARQARRPDPGRAGAGQAGHPGRQPGRRASAGWPS